MLAKLGSAGRIASAACAALAVTALFTMMAMTFVDVILRSTLGQPLEAATELTRVLMAITVFSMLPVMSATGGHITVDLLDHFLSAGARRVLDAVVFIVCGVMLFWPAQRCMVLAERARDYGDVTEYLAIPTFYLAWFITLSVFVTAIILILCGLIRLFWSHQWSQSLNDAAPDSTSVNTLD